MGNYFGLTEHLLNFIPVIFAKWRQKTLCLHRCQHQILKQWKENLFLERDATLKGFISLANRGEDVFVCVSSAKTTITKPF